MNKEAMARRIILSWFSFILLLSKRDLGIKSLWTPRSEQPGQAGSQMAGGPYAACVAVYRCHWNPVQQCPPLLSSRNSRAPHDHLGQTRALLANSPTEGTAHILLVKYVYFFPVQVHWQMASDTLCPSKGDKRAIESYKPTGSRSVQALLTEAASVNGARMWDLHSQIFWLLT